PKGACPPKPWRRGAIAQLVERVLCKHEVVGSIPSGSTSLRANALRLGKPPTANGCRAEARRAKADYTAQRSNRFRRRVSRRAIDIVKEGSPRPKGGSRVDL